MFEQTTPIPLNPGPQVPTFPVDAFPPFYAKYVEALAEATQVPVDMAATTVLGTLAACVGGKAKVRLRNDWSEHLCLYVVTAMEPGNRKSGVYDAVRGPLGALEDELQAEASPIISQAQARKDFREAAAQKSLRGKSAISEAEYEQMVIEAESVVVPEEPQILADDATPEAIAIIADSQGGRLVIASDEGGIFENFNGRYSGKPNLDVFLKGWDGGTTKVDRVGRKPLKVKNLTLTFVLLVQPAVLREIGKTSVNKTRGELERWLYSVPKDFLGYRNIDAQEMPQELRDQYNSTVLDLGRRFVKAEEILELSLTAAAKTTFREVRKKNEKRLRRGGMLGNPRVKGWGAKLDGHIARIAGILHIASGRQGTQVDADLITAADRIGDYYAQHALAAFHLMDTQGHNAEAEELLSKIQEFGWSTFTRRDLARKTGRLKAEILDPLQVLLDHGWLEEVDMGEHSGVGRKPSQVYNVHPLAFEDEDTLTQLTESTEWAENGDSVKNVNSVRPGLSSKNMWSEDDSAFLNYSIEQERRRPA